MTDGGPGPTNSQHYKHTPPPDETTRRKPAAPTRPPPRAPSGEEDTVTMDLTLHRAQERTAPQSRLRPLVAMATGPVAVLAAGCVLAAGFLVAVSDLVNRLG